MTTCTSWFSEQVCSYIEVVGSALNSSFTIALIGSAAGAFAGAFGAQRIVQRSQTRERVTVELRNTNAANANSFQVCNLILSFKKQYIAPLYNEYVKTRTAYVRLLELGDQVGDKPEFKYLRDLRSFRMPRLPGDALGEEVRSRLSVQNRPLHLISVIEASITALEEALEARDQIIEQFKNGSIGQDEAENIYFGVPFSSGHVNEEYTNLIQTIHDKVDDIIFFSSLLCQDLTKHGKRIRDESGIARSTLPKVSEYDFKKAENEGLMPESDNYSDWLSIFNDGQ